MGNEGEKNVRDNVILEEWAKIIVAIKVWVISLK